MTNNLTAKFDGFYVTPQEAAARLSSNVPAQPIAYYAVNEYISVIRDIGLAMGMNLDETEIFADLLGYGQNSDEDMDSAAASLNSQLIPIIGVTLSMRRSLGLPLR